jgi:3-hydroxyisobutyrate dehydrogenase-like beta-hydroxyacid dehydrogenase
MQPSIVAILSPGEMGAATGNVLREGGLRVVSCLRGRSESTRKRAEEAGIEDVADLDELVTASDVILSIVAPAHAREVAKATAEAIERTSARKLFVDCNAISPMTVKEIAQTIERTGARFGDVGIIGNPPKPGPQATRYYASGEHAHELEQLNQHGLDFRVIGDEAGQASALKMCYAALTKGLTALATELHIAADRSGVAKPLQTELEMSQANLLEWIRRMVPTMPPKAWRWIGEMEEIAATFAGLGLTPKLLEGAADMYRLIEQEPELARLPAPSAYAPSAAGSAHERSKAG